MIFVRSEVGRLITGLAAVLPMNDSIEVALIMGGLTLDTLFVGAIAVKRGQFVVRNIFGFPWNEIRINEDPKWFAMYDATTYSQYDVMNAFVRELHGSSDDADLRGPNHIRKLLIHLLIFDDRIACPE